MSAPETAAGKLIRSLTEIWWKAGGVTTPDQHRMVAQVRAIEAEARAAAIAEAIQRVEALPESLNPNVRADWTPVFGAVDRHQVVAILRDIETKGAG